VQQQQEHQHCSGSKAVCGVWCERCQPQLEGAERLRVGTTLSSRL
jgi:hypothetical protein